MLFFRQWTKKQIAAGSVLLVVLLVVLFGYTFIADFEYAKSHTYQTMGEEITQEEAQQQQLVEQLHAQLDDQLLQSSEDSPVVRDAQFRDDFQTLQTIFIDLMIGENAAYIEEVKTTFDEQNVSPSSLVSVYVDSTDMTNGYVYFIGNGLHVFSFTYEDGQVTGLTPIQEGQMEQIQVVDN